MFDWISLAYLDFFKADLTRQHHVSYFLLEEMESNLPGFARLRSRASS